MAPDAERPYADEVGADPGRLRIGLLTRAPGGQVEVHPDCVAAAEEAARLLESLGHSVEIAEIDALDDPDYIPQFLVRWTAGVAWNLDYWARKTGREIGPDDVEPSTWALAEQGRIAHRRRLPDRDGVRPGGGPARGRVVGVRVRPAAHAHAGRAAHPAGRLRPPARPAAAADRARRRRSRCSPPAFNSTGQPAISLPLHENDDGLPDRRSSSWPSWAARTCCCGSPRSSRRRRRGRTAARRCSPAENAGERAGRLGLPLPRGGACPSPLCPRGRGRGVAVLSVTAFGAAPSPAARAAGKVPGGGLAGLPGPAHGVRLSPARRRVAAPRLAGLLPAPGRPGRARLSRARRPWSRPGATSATRKARVSFAVADTRGGDRRASTSAGGSGPRAWPRRW